MKKIFTLATVAACSMMSMAQNSCQGEDFLHSNGILASNYCIIQQLRFLLLYYRLKTENRC